jgi:hypothetical protein
MTSYDTSLITFFDILGFKEIVKNGTPDHVAEILDFLRRLAKDDVEDDVRFSPNVVIFSDSVVRTRRVKDQPKRLGILFLEILSLLTAQMELANRGVLVRGAMTIGEVVSSPGRVFGPGLIEAYELESQIAQYPRIMISPKVLQALDESEDLISDINALQKEKEYIKGLLRFDNDGIWFIDYLGKCESEVDSPEDYITLLRKNKTLISKYLKSSKLAPSVKQKYAWYAMYHNSVIEGLKNTKDFNTSKKELKVPIAKSLYEF